MTKPMTEIEVGPALDQALAEALGGRYTGVVRKVYLDSAKSLRRWFRNPSTDASEAFRLARHLQKTRGWLITIFLYSNGLTRTLAKQASQRRFLEEETYSGNAAESICRAILRAATKNDDD